MLRTREDWQLTARELKTLEWMRKGLAIKEIAAKLGVTIRCTKHHIGNVYRKFGVSDRLGLHQVVGFHKRRAK